MPDVWLPGRLNHLFLLIMQPNRACWDLGFWLQLLQSAPTRRRRWEINIQTSYSITLWSTMSNELCAYTGDGVVQYLPLSLLQLFNSLFKNQKQINKQKEKHSDSITLNPDYSSRHIYICWVWCYTRPIFKGENNHGKYIY